MYVNKLENRNHIILFKSHPPTCAVLAGNHHQFSPRVGTLHTHSPICELSDTVNRRIGLFIPSAVWSLSDQTLETDVRSPSNKLKVSPDWPQALERLSSRNKISPICLWCLINQSNYLPCIAWQHSLVSGHHSLVSGHILGSLERVKYLISQQCSPE